MPKGDKLTQAAVLRLPPMLWWRIRWHKSMGSPVGDAATGFRVRAEEHTATQLRIGRSGPEPTPGTGVLTAERHLQSVDFKVVYEPWRR